MTEQFVAKGAIKNKRCWITGGEKGSPALPAVPHPLSSGF